MSYITGIVYRQPDTLNRVTVRIDAGALCWARARLEVSMKEELANFSTLPVFPNKTESVSVINL